MLRRLMLHWFWDTYDALGRLVVLNLLIATVFLVVFFFGALPATGLILDLAARNPALGAMVFLALFTVGGAAALTFWLPGLIHFVSLVTQDREHGLKDYFSGLRRRGGAFFRLSLLGCFYLAVIAINMAFYSRSDVFGGSLRLVGAALAGLCFWLELLGLGVLVNAMPLAARGERSLRESLKLGLYVTLRYPFFTYGALLFLAVLWVLSVVLLKTAPLWIIGFAATGTYINGMHDVAVRQEEIREEEARKAAEPTERGDGRPTSWKQIRQDEEAEQEPKDRYQRTLRDILKPWE